ncbi:MAG: zinc ribbon domain-containing protein [Chloroflexi bacterium]|nr:zinc ribbon domain-containing protein [Chloroflexota bacterium]
MRRNQKLAALLLGVSLLALLAVALARPPAGRAQENPRLAGLQIEVWPEFDRPAALVILRGELAADVTLPAAVSLRIPAASGGPLAVATADTPDGELFNLTYQRADAPDFVTLKFSLERRVFHVELYDPLRTEEPQRSYTYTWPGDFAVAELTARVQEPAGATGFSVEPDLGPGARSAADGLVYRRASLGALEAGQTLAITLGYLKTDPRNSVEILGLAEPDETVAPGSGDDVSVWLLPLAASAGAVAGAALVAVWYRRGKLLPARAGGRGAGGRPADGQRFCAKCGAAIDPGDHFCRSCGAEVRRR